MVIVYSLYVSLNIFVWHVIWTKQSFIISIFVVFSFLDSIHLIIAMKMVSGSTYKGRGAFPGTIAVEVSWLYNLFLPCVRRVQLLLHSLVYISSLRCHFLWNLPAWWWAWHTTTGQLGLGPDYGYLQTPTTTYWWSSSNKMVLRT